MSAGDLKSSSSHTGKLEMMPYSELSNDGMAVAMDAGGVHGGSKVKRKKKKKKKKPTGDSSEGAPSD